MDKIYVLTPTLSFEVAESDLPEMEWKEARQYSLTVGDRWRLPTKEELDELYRLHQKAVGSFKFEHYWSSEGFGNNNAFAKNFASGNYSTGVSSKYPVPKYFARLVRNI